MRERSFSLQLFSVCEGYLIRHVEVVFERDSKYATFSILLCYWICGLQTSLQEQRNCIFMLQQWFRTDTIYSYGSSLCLIFGR